MQMVKKNIYIYFEILGSLLFSSMKAGFCGGIIWGVLLFSIEPAEMWLSMPVMAFIVMLVGPFFSFPALVGGAFVLFFLIKKKISEKRFFILSGFVVGILYSLIFNIIGPRNSDSQIFPFLFIFCGSLTGYFVHPELKKLIDKAQESAV